MRLCMNSTESGGKKHIMRTYLPYVHVRVVAFMLSGLFRLKFVQQLLSP